MTPQERSDLLLANGMKKIRDQGLALFMPQNKTAYLAKPGPRRHRKLVCTKPDPCPGSAFCEHCKLIVYRITI